MSTWKTELNNDCNDVKEILLINKLTSDHKLNATEVNSKSPCNSRFPGTFSSFSSVSSWPRVYFRVLTFLEFTLWVPIHKRLG